MDYSEPKIIPVAAAYVRSGEGDGFVIATDLAIAIADQTKFLYEKRKQMLWPKDMEKGLTELDRTTRLNGDLAFPERDLILLEKLEVLVLLKLKGC